MEPEIIIERPHWSINGMNYWTLGWRIVIDGVVYGKFWPKWPPGKKDLPRLKEEIKKAFEIWTKKKQRYSKRSES